MSPILLLLLAPVAPAGPCPDGAPAVVADLAATLAAPPSGLVTRKPSASHRPPSGVYQGVYDANAKRAERFELKERGYGSALDAFLENWRRNRERYEKVAEAADLPPELVAAIHWRESTGDFGTYLHQGDPLGRPAVHDPTDIPVFHDWESAALHALQQQDWLRQQLRITKETTDVAALATYAEAYNGLGYYYKGRPSPYAWAATSEYSRGKYVSDGRYRSWVKDRQPGVVAMVTLARQDRAGSR